MSWNKYIAGTVVCLAMLLSSCRSTKSITDVTPESTARTEQIVSALNGKKVESSRPLTAKLSLELQMGSKGVTVRSEERRVGKEYESGWRQTE